KFLPVNGHTGGLHPLACHTRRGVNDFRGAHEHLFGMAPTQRTGAAERACINDGHGPPRGTTPEARCGRGAPRPTNANVILSLLLCHALSASLYTPVTAASRWWQVRQRVASQIWPWTDVHSGSCTPGGHAMHGLIIGEIARRAAAFCNARGKRVAEGSSA